MRNRVRRNTMAKKNPLVSEFDATKEDVESIRQDIFNYSRERLGFSKREAELTAQIAVEAITGTGSSTEEG